MKMVGYPLALSTVPRLPYGQAVAGAYGTPRTLGFLEFLAPIASAIGGIFGAKTQADAMADAAKEQRRGTEATILGQTEQARIMADAYRYGTDAQMNAAKVAAEYAFKAAQAKSEADLAAVETQYGAALNALRQQRMAAIDTQASQLIQNTSGAIFALSSQGLTETGRVTTTYPRWGAGALVALAAVTLYAMTRGKGKKRTVKFRGHEYAAEPA